MKIMMLIGLCLAAVGTVQDPNTDTDTQVPAYHNLILADHPVGYWRFSEPDARTFANEASAQGSLVGILVGHVVTNEPGPRPGQFPSFNDGNRSIDLPGRSGYVRVADPGEQSPLDFGNGDAITLEAWVSPASFTGGQYAYVVGKGRTHNAGFAADNQNYALRLKSEGGGGAVTFLFRSDGAEANWHRWTSKQVLPAGGGWHHVAVSYVFGDPSSIRGYIDGQAVSGQWDMGGATTAAPVIDDDDLWIGSSMGGQLASTFHGRLDEVAVYRSALPADKIHARYTFVAPALKVDLTRVPAGGVLVDVFEGIADNKSWQFREPLLTDSYELPGFVFVDVPKKYSNKGIQVDRGAPFLIRAYGQVFLPPGPQRILVRCRNASRLFMDDRQIATTDFHGIPSSGHGEIDVVDTSLAPRIRPLQRGDTETVVNIEGDGREHWFRFEMLVGGQKHRPEFGETGVFLARPGADFQLLSQSTPVPLTDSTWPDLVIDQQRSFDRLNAENRRTAGAGETAFWKRRHQIARDAIQALPPLVIPAIVENMRGNNKIDRFIAARLSAAGQNAAEPVDDLAFLRRVTLDTTGVIPTIDQIEQFLADPPEQRRQRAIDRLLDDPGWADHWVGYWQDVLAENPNIVNPTLNNTGPFRWWIHESFTDNKPADRMVTELIQMEGSRYYGGPAGFGLATQNDAPMAAKAHVVAQAFLAVQLKCARCHDAPYHDLAQRDLFSLAASLARQPQSVPATSTIPGGDEAVNSLLVEVTLKPGEPVAPAWPFPAIMSAPLEEGVLRNPNDSRAHLAALITSAHNRRFARVMANRLWKRYLGHGLVNPVDDWETALPSHPDLLEYLARELVLSGYNLKHVARLILNSEVYQRRPQPVETLAGGRAFLFSGPLVRRMDAEQLVDSLLVACGKPYDSDPMCVDIDGARPENQSLNLGRPTRAWHFTSLSNERDRPSLALPFAQPYVTLMETFGWRGSRQDPISERPSVTTVLQPAIVANGLLSRRAARLSNDSDFTRLALRDQPLDQLIHRIYLKTLGREPSDSERTLFAELLEPGYTARRLKPATTVHHAPAESWKRNLVSWSNHLNPEATVIKVELEEAVRRGDPPTDRLAADWRDRLEDMIWTLINSPEFVYLP